MTYIFTNFFEFNIVNFVTYTVYLIKTNKTVNIKSKNLKNEINYLIIIRCL